MSQVGYADHGSILIASTPAQDLRFYEVYVSDGAWAMPPQFHDWTYQGTVQELSRISSQSLDTYTARIQLICLIHTNLHTMRHRKSQKLHAAMGVHIAHS